MQHLEIQFNNVLIENVIVIHDYVSSNILNKYSKEAIKQALLTNYGY